MVLLGRRRELKTTKLLDHSVTKVNAIFVFVVKGTGTVALATLFLLHLHGIHLTFLVALLLCLSYFDSSFLHLFQEAFLALSCSLINYFSLGFFFLVINILSFLMFFNVFRAEINELLT